MSRINESAIGEGEALSKSFQERLAACTDAESIKRICHDEELRQNKIVLDWDESYRIPVETPQARSFASTIVVNGQKIVLESDSELSLKNLEIETYRKLLTPPAAGEQERDDRGRFTADNHSAADDITQNLVTHALQEAGINPEALRAISVTQYEQSWAQATEDFLHGPGSDWIGGEANMRKLGERIIAMGLDGSPSVDSLAKAYTHLKQNNELVANPELERADRIAAATTPQALRAACGYRGDMWGR